VFGVVPEKERKKYHGKEIFDKRETESLSGSVSRCLSRRKKVRLERTRGRPNCPEKGKNRIRSKTSSRKKAEHVGDRHSEEGSRRY